MKPKIKRRYKSESFLQPTLLLLPFLILFFLFAILPILSSVVLSFSTFDMLNLPKFNGVQNYVRLFLYDDMFKIALKNYQLSPSSNQMSFYMLALK